MSQGLATFQSSVRQWFVRGGGVTTPAAAGDDSDVASSANTSAPTATLAVNDGTPTGDLRTFQSSFKQQFIREGGGIDLTTGTAIDPSGAGSSSSSDDGGQLPGEGDAYRIHRFEVAGATLSLGTVFASNLTDGAATPNWTWQVTITGTFNSQWIIVVEGELAQQVKTMNYTGRGFAESLLWTFTTTAAKPLWHVTEAGSDTALPDDKGQFFFNYIPNAGQ